MRNKVINWIREEYRAHVAVFNMAIPMAYQSPESFRDWADVQVFKFILLYVLLMVLQVLLAVPVYGGTIAYY